MTRETKAKIRFAVNTKMYQQLQVAFDHEFIRTETQYDEHWSEGESEGEDAIHDYQATHYQTVAKNIYGRKGLRGNNMLTRLFRGMSDKTQNWYGMRQRPDHSWFDKIDIGNNEGLAESGFDKNTIRSTMNKSHEQDAKWRSVEQRRSVYGIVNGISPLISILPTSGGKTS